MAERAHSEEVKIDFQTALVAGEEVLAAASHMVGCVSALQAARANFLASGQELLEDPIWLARQFGRPSKYYGFLARLGRESDCDVLEEQDTTARTAAVLGDLHKPGTLAYLKTRVRANRADVPTIAIGEVAAVPRMQIMERGPRNYKKDLVALVQIAAQLGEPSAAEVGVDDIARHFDGREIGSTEPRILVGETAVRRQVEQAYNDWRYLSQDSSGAFEALTRSGLRLFELGVPEEEIAAKRQLAIEGLRHAVMRPGEYRREAVKLPALCQTTREALYVVDDVLGDKDPAVVSSVLAGDYRLLQENVGPAQQR